MLNCDLGEDEPPELTEALLRRTDAASICCGAHAGSPEKTRETLRRARECGVLVGAHPGLAEAGGRGARIPDAAEFGGLLEAQLGRFAEWAVARGVGVDYVKLHGSLYHAVERDPALRATYLERLGRAPGGPGLFARAGGCCAADARARGLRVWAEIFADRAYTAAGELVPRNRPGAVLDDGPAVKARLAEWVRTGRMRAVDGTSVELEADTVCVHADSPGALAFVEELGALLRDGDASGGGSGGAGGPGAQ